MMAPAEISARTLTGFDWMLVAVVAVSAVMAFQRGFVRVAFSLGGLALGMLVASWNYVRLARVLQAWISSRAASEAVAFLAILMAVVIVFSLVGGLVRRTVKAVGLGFVDRVLGAGVGVVRGVLLAGAVIAALAAFAPGSEWLRNSVAAPYFLAGVHAVSFVVPAHLEAQVAEGAKHLREKAPGVLKQSARSQ